MLGLVLNNFLIVSFLYIGSCLNCLAFLVWASNDTPVINAPHPEPMPIARPTVGKTCFTLVALSHFVFFLA